MNETFPDVNPHTGLPWTVVDLMDVIVEMKTKLVMAVHAANRSTDIIRTIQIWCAQTEVLFEQTGAKGIPGIPVSELDRLIMAATKPPG